MKKIIKSIVLTFCLFTCINEVAFSQFYTNGSSMVYTYDKVGIGVKSPESKLEVKGTTTLGARWKPQNAYFKLTDNSSGNSLIADNNEIYSSSDLSIGTAFDKDFQFRNVSETNYQNLMIIKGSGKVGIGTSDPESKLEVKGTTTLGAKWKPQNAYFKLTDGNSDNSLIADNNEIYSSSDLSIGTAFDKDFQFRNVSENNYENLMTIKSNGNVGIGTTNPESKLAVNGKITSKTVEVTIENWPDFVFEENYNLRSLEDVAKYINENKHLPDVPSEKQILSKGFSLGEMDAVLLRKIEELTLYMIDFKSYLSDLKKENEILKVNLLKLEKSNQ